MKFNEDAMMILGATAFTIVGGYTTLYVCYLIGGYCA